ncbi:hypothetical protein [Gordonia paraffinivorans]|uniref:hypothetical protein n=1 Tax=Gordonia paraffinivorans TaxID=175628 RepID=UPI001E551691|nr:hypothetical protein [Gordonia paraffinivorans]MCD2145540.1 hypothetical protein [Gordonia paraffinivorans]
MNQWPPGDPARFGHPPHRPNPWPAPPPPQTYGPVVRTHVIADEGMAKRIQRENGRGSLLATVIPIWLSQAIGLGAMWFGMTDERKVTLVLTAAFALITVISILMMTAWTPYMIRRYYGAGIPLSAEFGPDHIAFTSGTHTQVVRLPQIGRIIVGRNVIRIRVHGAYGERIVIPRELVPTNIAASLGERFDNPGFRHWV